MIAGKKLVICAVFAFIGINLHGKENGFTLRPFFGGGGGTAVFDGSGGYGLGGYGEFAFLFFEKGLQISSHLAGRGDSINTVSENHYGAGSIIGKISLGGLLPNNNFRGYSFVEGGLGLAGGSGGSALNIVFGGGGGIDLFFHKKGSIYLEVGYLQHYLNSELVGGICISIGTRGYY